MKSNLSKNSLKNDIKENYNKDNKSNFNIDCRNYLINVKKSLLKKRISKKRKIIDSCKKSVKNDIYQFDGKKNINKENLLKFVSPRKREEYEIVKNDYIKNVNSSIKNKRLIYQSNEKSENFQYTSESRNSKSKIQNNLSKLNNLSKIDNFYKINNKSIRKKKSKINYLSNKKSKSNLNFISKNLSNKKYHSKIDNYSKTSYSKTDNYSKIDKSKTDNLSKTDNNSKIDYFSKNNNLSNNISILENLNPISSKSSISLIKKRFLKNVAKKIFPLNKYGILLLRSIIRDLTKMIDYKKKKEFFGITYHFDTKFKIKKKFFEKEKFVIFFNPNNFFFKEKTDFIRNKKLIEINEKGFEILSKNKDFFKFIFLVSKSKNKFEKFSEIAENLAYFKKSINQVIKIKNNGNDLKNIKCIKKFSNINKKKCILLDSKLENFLFNPQNFVYFPKFLTNNNFKDFNKFLVNIIKKIKRKDFSLKVLNDKYCDLLGLK